MTAVSVVVAVYNAQPWLDRFFASLRRQTLRDFEVLMVDDGSTDESAAMIAEMAGADPRFRLVRLPVNAGAGTARNTGIREAKGETLCFADPDDLLPETSLEVRYTAYKRHNAIVRACHDEIGDDGSMRNHETRPDRLPEIFSPVDEAERVGVNPFLCAHWTWLFPTELLRRHKILNGENMRTAEDIVLLNKLFFHVNRMVWIPDTVYFWMKHEESLSTTRYTAEHYENYFQCCDVFYREAGKHRRMELADQFFDGYLALYPGHLLAQAARGGSDETDAQKLIAATARIAERYAVFKRCAEVLRRNPAHYAGLCRLMAALQSDNQSALLRLVESQRVFNRLMEEKKFEGVREAGWSRQVSFDKLDREAGLVRARYLFCDNRPEERFVSGGRDAQPAYAKNRTVHTGDGYVIFERILWLPLPLEENERIALTVAGQGSGLDHTASQLRAAFAPRPLNDAGFPPDVRALRRLARSGPVREKFRDAWLFMDRDTEADDNAEHLYRWVRSEHPEINAWFVLREDSHDWPRLEAEGFRLVAHGTMEHFALFLSAGKLVSSQMDHYIYAPLEERYYSDFQKPTFICLQHGVIKEDLSSWLNPVPIDMFVTTTPAEYSSIVADGTAYVMTKKEVRLTSLPRFDALLEPVKQENTVLVMPTWRADLVGEWDGKGQRRERNADFYSSSYVATWKDVFDDERFKALLDHYGYGVIFFAHPGFEQYLDGMPFPAYVDKRSKRHGSLMNLMKQSRVMITDFSSVAYDMAHAKRAVLYYQPEDEAEYARRQNRKTGFFRYSTMGFGPVCHDRNALLAALEETLRAGGVPAPEYARREKNTFSHHDRRSCRRVFESIQDSSRPFNATRKDG